MKTEETIRTECEMMEVAQKTLDALNKVRFSKDARVVLKHARAALHCIYSIQEFAPQDAQMVAYIQNMAGWAEHELAKQRRDSA